MKKTKKTKKPASSSRNSVQGGSKTVAASSARSRAGARTPARKTKTSPALLAVHETASGMYRAGVIDQTTMREFDVLCLPEVPSYGPDEVRAIRMKCQASQAVFAKCFNVTVSSVQKWETGAKKPGAIACKLLNLVDKQGIDILLA